MDQGRDVLLVGSPTNLLAYGDLYPDAERNSDLFDVEVRDGVFCMALGNMKINEVPTSIALVGGNCSVVGLNKKGEDVFWTVAGDNVSSLAFAHIESEDNSEILMGSEDYAIRIFRGEELIYDINESAKVTALMATKLGRYAYALDNGTLGLYNKTHRVWRAKTKNKVITLTAGDVNGDGQPEIVVGWSNGRFEVRSEAKGEPLYKKMVKEPISKVILDDLRLDGTQQTIICTESGKVIGLAQTQESAPQEIEANPDRAQELVEELSLKKQTLLNELNSLVQQPKRTKAAPAVLPSNTQVNINLELSEDNKETEVRAVCSGKAVIRGFALFSDSVFETGSVFVHPDRASQELRYTVRNTKYVEADIEAVALVGASEASSQYLVIERKLTLPKFCMFKHTNSGSFPSPNVQFDLRDHPSKILSWAERRFLVDANSLRLRPDGNLEMVFEGAETCVGIRCVMNRCAIHVNSMEVAGELVQDLAMFLGLHELESRAEFPEDIRNFLRLLKEVEDFSSARTQLTVNMAEAVQNVKSLIVRAEDSRILRNFSQFKKTYSQLQLVNSELIGEFQKRQSNHNELLSILKKVNQYIQRAGNLRFGQAKTRVIAALREAIKAKNASLLTSVSAT